MLIKAVGEREAAWDEMVHAAHRAAAELHGDDASIVVSPTRHGLWADVYLDDEIVGGFEVEA